MSTSIVDGTIEAVDLKRARAGLAIFNSIRFKLDDGSSRTVTKYVVPQEIADAFAPGVSGRFYLFSAFDMKGIHGFRGADGAAHFRFPGGSNTKLFLIIVIVNILWIALRVTTKGDVPFLGVGLVVLGIIGYVLMSKGGREAKAQFEADEGFAAKAPLPA